MPFGRGHKLFGWRKTEKFRLFFKQAGPFFLLFGGISTLFLCRYVPVFLLNQQSFRFTARAEQ